MRLRGTGIEEWDSMREKGLGEGEWGTMNGTERQRIRGLPEKKGLTQEKGAH